MDKRILLSRMKQHHCGYRQAASSKELENAVLASVREIRDAVNERRRDGEDICSGSNGYYYAADTEELVHSIRQLGSRIRHIAHARSGIVLMDRPFMPGCLEVYIFFAITILTCCIIVSNEIGLIEELDFGPGQYYFTDVPGWEELILKNRINSNLSLSIYLVLVTLWGIMMMNLWLWVDKMFIN